MNIGDRVKDVISGFEGIATGMTEYLNGCRQFLVSPEKLNKDGAAVKPNWIDEQSLTVIKRGIRPNPFAAGAAPTAGGPNRSSRVGE